MQDDENAQLALDGIFADSYNRWGGRFSLIVPCREGRIVDSFWPLLEAYDADMIYSYVPLTPGNILELYDRVSPGHYKLHEHGRNLRREVHGFRPSLGFTSLSSMSTIFRLARYSRSPQGRPIKVIDSWYTEKPSRFLTDNLGTYHISHGGAMFPADAMSAAALLTIVSPDKQANRRYGVPSHLESVPDEATAFSYFINGSTTSLSVASIIFAPKLDIAHGRWTSSFNLVVGESYDDRIIFWDGRLFIPGWLDTDLCCARVTLEDIDEPEFFQILVTLIKRHSSLNGGSGGPPQVTIRSASQTTDNLERVRERLMVALPWSVIKTEVVPSLDLIAPNPEALQAARESEYIPGSLTPPPRWRTFSWSPPTVRPPAAAPDHLVDAPPRQIFAQGYWASDFMLEYDGPGPALGQDNYWQLPRRWRMAGFFKLRQTGGSSGSPLPARRSRDGNLGLYASVDHPIDSIRVGSALDGINYALAVDGSWAKQAAERGETLPPRKVVWTRLSNEARYLTGVLGMTGGLARARDALLHPFLQRLFADFGGSPHIPEAKLASTIARLKKAARRSSIFDLTDDQNRRALADMIVKAGREQKSHLHFVNYEELRASWKSYREEYWKRNHRPASVEQEDIWDEREESSLDQTLIEMRRRHILFQGHRWVCPICHHRNWVDLAALSAQLSCEVCTRVEQAPVDIRWLFRPNEFLIESLRDHSVLSLIWALTALSDRARRSFIFVEPICFGFTEEEHEEEPSAEIDLVLIVDGEAILCEVKSSWRFKPVEIEEFVDLAIRLRPDIAILAVMEQETGPTALLNDARTRLEANGVKFEVLTPKGVMLRDRPYLNLS